MSIALVRRLGSGPRISFVLDLGTSSRRRCIVWVPAFLPQKPHDGHFAAPAYWWRPACPWTRARRVVRLQQRGGLPSACWGRNISLQSHAALFRGKCDKYAAASLRDVSWLPHRPTRVSSLNGVLSSRTSVLPLSRLESDSFRLSPGISRV